ncbi:MAG: DUF3768 domain-containing protein [Cucumibacter sp.]
MAILGLTRVVLLRCPLAVRESPVFDDDNDPNQEHDFGGLCLGDRQHFRKIDYYDALWIRGFDQDRRNPPCAHGDARRGVLSNVVLVPSLPAWEQPALEAALENQ